MIRSTKFWLALGSFISAGVFLALGYIGEQTWKELLIWILGLYGAGNVAATWAHTRRE